MNRVYVFTINPVPKGRPKFSTVGGFPRAVTPSKTRRFEKQIAILATELNIKNNWKSITGIPIKVEIIFFLERPKHIPKNRKLPMVKPDLDNLYKSVTDALNEIVWEDDNLICEAQIKKEYSSDKAFIVLNLEAIE